MNKYQQIDPNMTREDYIDAVRDDSLSMAREIERATPQVPDLTPEGLQRIEDLRQSIIDQSPPMARNPLEDLDPFPSKEELYLSDLRMYLRGFLEGRRVLRENSEKCSYQAMERARLLHQEMAQELSEQIPHAIKLAKELRLQPTLALIKEAGEEVLALLEEDEPTDE